MATLDNERAGVTPWLLSAPALLLFGSLLLVPLLLTLVLSFHVFSDSQGTLATYTLRNYLEVITDPYYGAIFARTAGMAFAVTFLCILLGVPETIVLARMKRPWQSVCLLVVLGPLLISVVVRTLGWQILLGNNGVLNNALQALHITIGTYPPRVHHDRGCDRADARAGALHGDVGVGNAAEARPAGGMGRPVYGCIAVSRVPARGAAADPAGHPVWIDHCVCAVCIGICYTVVDRRAASKSGRDRCVRRVPRYAELASGGDNRCPAADRQRGNRTGL